MPPTDEFLTDLYDRLHATPTQEKFRHIRPLPVGVVFVEWPGMTDEDIRGHFRTMRELGFTCLKGISLCRGTDRTKVMHMALDEGLIPWWYDQGGWEPITNELLAKLGIDASTSPEAIREDPRMLAHQEKVMRARIDAGDNYLMGRHSGGRPRYHSADMLLHEEAMKPFVAWLRETYGTVEKLGEAWNFHHAMVPAPEQPLATWDDAEDFIRDWWAHGQRKQEGLVPHTREYRRLRDILRFKADVYLDDVRERSRRFHEHDPHAPMRAGGEMALFLPFAARATDMEGIADVMATEGSFYPSIHMAWHFEEVEYEVPRPVYMMAQITQDWFKGGWAASWESTGGPQQFSGGKAPFCPAAEHLTPGVTVSAGVMTQLMLSYLAAGLKGFGLWCWTARTVGWEAGEFALTDRQGKPCERTIQVGRIGRAARRLRDELWSARKEPQVGIYVDFDNEAIWAAMAVPGRDHYKHWPIHARIGASRALINANAPWEYVTASDIRNGLAGRYKVIFLPATVAICTDVLAMLADYVRNGGRVVVDMPGAYYDEFGRLLDTAAGSTFEQVFGVTIRDFQYARNVPRSLHGRPLHGFVVDLQPTTANVLADYDDGQPGITENRCGKGTAVVMGWEAALTCYRPDAEQAERMLVKDVMGDFESPYACDEAIAYRLASPAADHYFLINDGPAKAVTLDTKNYQYSAWSDPVSEEAIAPGAPIDLPDHAGRWIRCEK